MENQKRKTENEKQFLFLFGEEKRVTVVIINNHRANGRNLVTKSHDSFEMSLPAIARKPIDRSRNQFQSFL